MRVGGDGVSRVNYSGCGRLEGIDSLALVVTDSCIT